MKLLKLRQAEALDGFDPEELEEIVGKAVERVLSSQAREPMSVASEIYQVYSFFEKTVGDKDVSVALTRLVYEVIGCGKA